MGKKRQTDRDTHTHTHKYTDCCTVFMRTASHAAVTVRHHFGVHLSSHSLLFLRLCGLYVDTGALCSPAQYPLNMTHTGDLPKGLRSQKCFLLGQMYVSLGEYVEVTHLQLLAYLCYTVRNLCP